MGGKSCFGYRSVTWNWSVNFKSSGASWFGRSGLCQKLGKSTGVLLVITARVRSTTGRYCFHRCLSVHRGGRGGPGTPPGGYPDPPPRVPDRVPPQGGVPGPPAPGGGPDLTGYPPGGYLTWPGTPPGGVPGPPRGGTWPDWVPPGGVPGPPPGGTWPDRVPPRGGTRTPSGGVPDLTGYPRGGTRTHPGGTQTPPGGVPDLTWLGTPPGGGTQLGQQRVFATQRAVCLLRSRRRTFLFIIVVFSSSRSPPTM